MPDLADADLREANLLGANLAWPHLSRADLSRADLTMANFSGANLAWANLSEANLTLACLSGADLSGAHRSYSTRTIDSLRDYSGANLREANLSTADLSGTNLSEADLSGANLSGATLAWANLSEANLTKANLSQVSLSGTIFSVTTLTAARGLDTCNHLGPSSLDHRTLAKSGPLPLAFLRGCGLNDWEIEAAKLYQPGLTPTQINDVVYRIYGLRADPLIQFYSCFISYASKDHTFAQRLYADLQDSGVRCWFAPEDMKAGARIRDTIDQQIRLRQKLLIILSSASLASEWVEDEVEAALEEERTSPERRTVLVPIKIDLAVEETNSAWARTIRRKRHIGDFTSWEDNDTYQKALTRLLRDLSTVERQP